MKRIVAALIAGLLGGITYGVAFGQAAPTATSGSGSVVANAPLTGSGTASSPLACTVATASVPGCLAAADFTAFNAKQGTITIAVPAVATDANGLAIASGVLNLEIADSTHPGSMSIAAQSFDGPKQFLSDAGFMDRVDIGDNIGRTGNPNWIRFNSGDLNVGWNGQAVMFTGAGISLRLSGGAEGNQDSSVLTLNNSGNATLAGSGTNPGALSTGRVVAAASPVGVVQNHGVTVFSVFADGGYQPKPQTLDTCLAALEGTVEFDIASGASSGHRTRLCVCSSDGSAVYKWQNLAGASVLDVGTATTCPD